MISLINKYVVVLDACVLIPISLCDLLLRLAEEPALYAPRWTDEILEEVRRNLTREPFNLSQPKADYRIECMRTAFPEALITGHEPLIGSMKNQEKDRHVLATAVWCKADAIVTANGKDFPKSCMDEFRLERMSPDRFLINQWHLDRENVVLRIKQQALSANKTMEDHLMLLV
jgi:predicted nucleic acid-binding protein